MSAPDLGAMVAAASRGYDAAFPGWKLDGLNEREETGVTLRAQDGRMINVDFQFGHRWTAPLYRCTLGIDGDGIVTRWCATPDLAVDAALAGAKAMAAVFGGVGE